MTTAATVERHDRDTEGTAESPVATGLILDARNPTFRDHPHEVLDELRRREPAHHDRDYDRVVLTRADDVAAVLSDRTLSADPFKARPTAYSRRTLTDAQRVTNSLLHMDDPDHGRLRRLVTKAFTARSVEEMRPKIEAIASELLDAIDPHRPFDVVARLAVPLPVTVIASMLGIEDTAIADFKRWSDDIALLFAPDRSPEVEARLLAAREGMQGCFLDTMAKRRIEPRDDLISGLVAAQENGDALTDQEILNTCRLLLAAGNTTTTDLIGNGVAALLENPDQLAKLAADPMLWKSAVEEILRYDTPITHTNRQALEDREIRGCPVQPGQTVTTMLNAANHDPALHVSPHALDIERANQKHLSFGGGVHFCLGASLARHEAEISFMRLFERFPRLRLVPGRPMPRKPMAMFSGFESIWVDPT